MNKDAVLLVLHSKINLISLGLGLWFSSHLRRLKLLTGVETSTLPVKRSGKEGKRQTSRRRRTKAAPKTPIFRRSIAMTSCCWRRRSGCPFGPLRNHGARGARATRAPPKKKVIEKFSSSYQQQLFGFTFPGLQTPWRRSRRRVCSTSWIV